VTLSKTQTNEPKKHSRRTTSNPPYKRKGIVLDERAQEQPADRETAQHAGVRRRGTRRRQRALAALGE
jgi:hypothetical protein